MRSLCNKPFVFSVLNFFLFPKIHFICHFTFYFIFWLPVVSFMILDMYKTKAQLEVPDYIKFTGPNNHVKRDAELTVRSDDQGIWHINRDVICLLHWSNYWYNEHLIIFIFHLYGLTYNTIFWESIIQCLFINQRRKMNYKVSFFIQPKTWTDVDYCVLCYQFQRVHGL